MPDFDERTPVCPVCGSDTADFGYYREILGKRSIIGCSDCISKRSIEDCDEFYAECENFKI